MSGVLSCQWNCTVLTSAMPSDGALCATGCLGKRREEQLYVIAPASLIPLYRKHVLRLLYPCVRILARQLCTQCGRR